MRLTQEARDQLRAANPTLRHELRLAIRALADEPRPLAALELRAPLQGWRIPVRHWRVLYLIDDQAHAVIVWRLATRGEVYRLD